MYISIFQAELRDFLASSGKSQSELSKVTGVSQSQISSWVNGQGKRFSKNAHKVRRIIQNYRKSSETEIPTNVANAVREFCGGSKEKSEVLTRLIQSLQPLVNHVE